MKNEQTINPLGLGMDQPGPDRFTLEDVYSQNQIVSLKELLDTVSTPADILTFVTSFGGLFVPWLGTAGFISYVAGEVIREYKTAVTTAYDDLRQSSTLNKVTIKSFYVWNDTLKLYVQEKPLLNVYGSM